MKKFVRYHQSHFYRLGQSANELHFMVKQKGCWSLSQLLDPLISLTDLDDVTPCAVFPIVNTERSIFYSRSMAEKKYSAGIRN